MIDANEYIRKYYPQCTEATEKDIRGFLAAIEKQSANADLKKLLENKEFLCKCMYTMRGKGLSETTYIKRKTSLAYLCDFLGVTGNELPLYDEVLANQDVECLFESLDSLVRFIDTVGSSVIKNYDPDIDLMHIKGIATLGWYGASIEDIGQLKTTALQHPQDTDIYTVDIPSLGKIPVRRQDYELLVAVSQIEHYKGIPSGRTQYLKPSNLLFRGVHENGGSNRIVQLLKRFNQNVPVEYDSRLVFMYLNRNAKFVEIHNDTAPITLVNKIVNHLGCPTNHAYMIKIQYALWAKRFFGETIC